jgi:hypothetical protein
MKTNILHGYMQKKSQAAVTVPNRRTDEFFIGWMKRLGNTIVFLRSP